MSLYMYKLESHAEAVVQIKGDWYFVGDLNTIINLDAMIKDPQGWYFQSKPTY